MTTPPTIAPARSNTTTTASERPDLIGDPPRLAEPTRAATQCPDLGLKASVRFARSPMPIQNEQSVARQAEDVRLALTAHGLELVLIHAELGVGGTEVESIDRSGTERDRPVTGIGAWEPARVTRPNNHQGNQAT